MSTPEAPVTSRIRIAQKDSRSGTRGRWQPRVGRSGGGSSGSTAAHTGLLHVWLTSHVWDVVPRKDGNRAEEVPARVQA